jgi:hypothetical protein
VNRDQRFLRDNPIHQRIEAAGGKWFVLESDDPDAIVAEVLERGIRGLDVDRLDMSFLERLPDLEVLTVRNWHADIAPLSALQRLWYLAFPDGWKGQLDGRAWPQLEVFHPNDCPRDGGGLETLLNPGSPLHDLHVGRYHRPDLTDLAVLRLENLSVWSSPKLTSLAGIEAQAQTLQVLDFYGLSNLASMEGVESLTRLEVLRLDGIAHVTTLEHIASLPGLRALDVFDLKGVESLVPLAGHPTLEFLAFGRTRDLDLAPLETIPNLKWFLTGTYKWNRDLHALPYAHDMAQGDPRRVEWSRLAHW